MDSHGRVKAVLSKSDVMSELVRHPSNYLEILDIPAMVSTSSFCVSRIAESSGKIL